jgi:anaerobic ribonucleoside-triphosphate reductase activating protein
MTHVLFIIDEATGQLTIEGPTGGAALALARPLAPAALPATPPAPGEAALRVLRIWHGSVAEGPGRRSVVQLAGCPIRCPGCHSRETWDPGGGRALAIPAIADALLDPRGAPRDGISVLGGEPFAQPDGLAALLAELRRRRPGIHLTLYSGYTLEALARRPEPSVRAALDLADLLIDGPYRAQLGAGAGEWRGSTNQRLIARPGRRAARLARRG